jgi:2,4-dienoyl-CoA reductase-like NADH-dependent reductase (Old Yellow Enzyme family)/thioredoxin reductase
MEITGRIDSRYRKILEHGFMGSLKCKNRLVMAPMGTRLASPIGAVTERQIEYYRERAKGGIGTIITEITCVDYPLGATGPTNMALHDNSYLIGHNNLVEEVHAYGTRIICQLNHAGRQTKPSGIRGLQPVAPSPIPCPFIKAMPRELGTDEVGAIVKKFVEAAVRARTAGYDGIELHGAHGYLISQFMSTSSNYRKDRYGGDLLKRMAFPLEIIKGIREEVGSDYPILFRMSAEEFIEKGRKIEESKRVAKLLEEAGVSVLDVTVGTYGSMRTMIEPMSYPEAWKIYLAESIKKVVSIPVIGVGVIRSPDVAEEILEKKKVDFVALGRAMLADPYWPQKVREGREKDINRCISCNTGCIGGRIFRDLDIRCTVNPLTGRERLKRQLAPVTKKKKIYVIGGGPAGMTAALVASEIGHEVTLFEKSDKLGGQLLLARTPPGKEKISWLIDHLLRQVQQREIEVRFGANVTEDTIIEGNPDSVIIATGAVPLIPEIPGIEQPFVTTSWDILEGKNRITDKIVLVAGGGTVGCETSLYLAPKNKKVFVVEMLDNLALDMEPINRMDLLSRVEASGIEVILKRKIHRIDPGRVVLLEQETMAEEEVRADAVVLALGAVAETGLAEKIEDKVDSVYSVGDCAKPRKIIDAIYEGFRAALTI